MGTSHTPARQKKATRASAFLTLSLLGLCSWVGMTSLGGLRGEIELIAATIPARVGVAVMGVESDEILTVDGNGRYPMQSVYKFPVAVAVLARVDSGRLSLDQKIHVRKSDLLPNTWSPLRENTPKATLS